MSSHVQPLPQIETKVSKWETPEELLLLEKVEKGGAGATNPYVYLKPLPVSVSLILFRVPRQPDQPLAISEGPGAAGQPQNALQQQPLRSPRRQC